MKRRDALLAVPASLLVFSRAIPHALAQAPDARTVAAWAHTFSSRQRVLRASFRQHFWNRVYGRTQSSRGRLTVSRPGRIRFDYDTPGGKVVVCDGERWTLYEPGDDGAAGQYVRTSAASDSTSALGFLTGTTSIDRDFRHALAPHTSTQPAHTIGLELRPVVADPRYRRVILYVDSRPETRGMIWRVSIEDPDGNWNRFDFISPTYPASVETSVFDYTPPSSAREITP